MDTDDVRDFIIEQLRWDGSREQLTDDFPLLENKVLDSLGLFKLVGHLESKYGVQIADEELLPSNFGTIRSIAALVDGKQG